MLHGDLEKLEIKYEESEKAIFIRLITGFLYDNHHTEMVSENPIILDIEQLNKSLPFELMIFDNVINNFLETTTLIHHIAKEWSGRYRDVYYAIPVDNKLEYTSYSNVTHHKIGKLLRMKGVVDSVTPFVSVPILYRFECPNCGKKYIDPFHPEITCQCGRKKLRYNDKDVVSRMVFNIQEKTTEQSTNIFPCYFEVRENEYAKYFFNPIFLGEQVELLMTPREVERIIDKKLSISYVMELKGIRLFKRRKITKKRKKEIITTIKGDVDSFSKIALSMTRKTHEHNVMKKMCFACAVGLKNPDEDLGEHKNVAFHVLVVGDPSTGKTYTAKQLLKYFQKSAYLQGSSTTSVGLLGGTDRIQGGGFIIRSGQVVKSNGSFIILDELDKMHEDQRRGLFTALSEGRHTVTSIAGSYEFSYSTSMMLIANPKGSKFEFGTSTKYEQLDLDAGFLSRTDVILFVDSLLNNEEIDEKECKELLAYSSGRKEYQSCYDEDFLLDYADVVKEFPNPKMDDSIKILCEQYFTKRTVLARAEIKKQRKNNSGYADASSLDKKKPIDLRLLNTLMKLSKIVARSVFAKKVERKHFEIAEQLIDKGMVEELEARNIEDLGVFEEKIRLAGETKIPVSHREKMEFIVEEIRTAKEMGWVDLLQKCVDVGISETQLNKYLDTLRNERMIFQPRGTFYSILE